MASFLKLFNYFSNKSFSFCSVFALHYNIKTLYLGKITITRFVGNGSVKGGTNVPKIRKWSVTAKIK